MNTYFQCKICKKEFESRDSVRNELYLVNGIFAGNYPEVCDKDIKKVGEFVGTLLKKPIKEKLKSEARAL